MGSMLSLLYQNLIGPFLASLSTGNGKVTNGVAGPSSLSTSIEQVTNGVAGQSESEDLKASPAEPANGPSDPVSTEASCGRAQGSLAAATATLRTGTIEEALGAAQVIHSLLNGEDLAEAPLPLDLAEEGVVRALLRLFDDPIRLLTTERPALKDTLLRICCQSKAGLAQLLAACSDPDPKIALGALLIAHFLLVSPMNAPRMLALGFAPTLVAALSHDAPYCRSVGAAIAASAAQHAKMKAALLAAGLVPALMRVVGEGCVSDLRPPPDPTLSPRPAGPTLSPSCHEREGEWQRTWAVVKDPCRAGCTSLCEILLDNEELAGEIAACGGAAKSLLRAVEQYSGEGEPAPIHILSILMQELAGKAKGRAFVKALVSEGLFRIIAGAISPHNAELARLGFNCVNVALSSIKVKGLLEPGLPEGLDALKRYIELGGYERGAAALLLHRIVWACNRGAWGDRVRAFDPKKVQKMAERLAEVTNGEDLLEVQAAELLILELVESRKGNSGLRAAVEGGFIKGSFNLLHRARSTLPAGSVNLAGVEKAVFAGLTKVARLNDESYMLQMLDCGLLPPLELAALSDKEEMQSFAIGMIEGLACVPKAMERVREAGLWPALLMHLTDSGFVDVLKDVALQLCGMAYCASEYAILVRDAGGLERVKAARDRLKGADPRVMVVLDFNIGVAEMALDGIGERAPKPPIGSLVDATPNQLGPDRPGRLPAAPVAAEASKDKKQTRGRPSHTEDARKGLNETRKCSSSGMEGGEARGGDTSRTRESRKKDRECAMCGQTSRGTGIKLRECGGCSSAYYCGRICQTRHWPSHRAACKGKKAAQTTS